MAWPFAAQAVLVVLAALLLVKVALPPHGRVADAEPTRIRHDIVEGDPLGLDTTPRSAP